MRLCFKLFSNGELKKELYSNSNITPNKGDKVYFHGDFVIKEVKHLLHYNNYNHNYLSEVEVQTVVYCEIEGN